MGFRVCGGWGAGEKGFRVPEAPDHAAICYSSMPLVQELWRLLQQLAVGLGFRVSGLGCRLQAQAKPVQPQVSRCLAGGHAEPRPRSPGRSCSIGHNSLSLKSDSFQSHRRATRTKP